MIGALNVMCRPLVAQNRSWDNLSQPVPKAQVSTQAQAILSFQNYINLSRKMESEWDLGPCTCGKHESAPCCASDSPMPENPLTRFQREAPHWYSGPRLWRTLTKVAATAGRKTILSALVLFFCLKDRDTPAWAKGVIVGALGYLILPADLLPDLPGTEVLVVQKASSVDHDPGAEMTTSDMMKTWHLCGLLEGAPTCVSINVEVEWESNQLDGESWDAGKKLDGGKWALKMAIEDGQIAISATGQVGDLPPASQACLGRHTFAELTKKACANTRIGK